MVGGRFLGTVLISTVLVREGPDHVTPRGYLAGSGEESTGFPLPSAIRPTSRAQ